MSGLYWKKEYSDLLKRSMKLAEDHDKLEESLAYKDDRILELEACNSKLEDQVKKLRDCVDLYKSCSCGCYVRCDVRNEARKTLAEIDKK